MTMKVTLRLSGFVIDGFRNTLFYTCQITWVKALLLSQETLIVLMDVNFQKLFGSKIPSNSHGFDLFVLLFKEQCHLEEKRN